MGIPFPTSKAFTATATGKMAIKVVLCALLLASANAAPAAPPAYPAEPAYPDLPPVYKYTYAVADDYSSSNFNAHEERDGYNAAGGYKAAPVVKVAPAPVVKVAPAPVYKPAPVYHPAPAYKPAPVYHAAPVYKPAPSHHKSSIKYTTAAPAPAEAKAV